MRLLEYARLELAAIMQEDGRVANPIGQNILLRELQTLQKNITAAAEALKNPAAGIGPYDVGVGLGRLCDATLKDPKWALHTVVGTDRCRSRVAKVLRTVERIAELLKHDAQGAGATQMGTGEPRQSGADAGRYSEAVRILRESENLYQDNSGLGEPEWSDALVALSPESIRAIAHRGWNKRGSAEATNEFLVHVLRRIAAERSPAEREQAIAILRGILDLPDDNTTGFTNLRGACISELDELNALPGVQQQHSQPSGGEHPFRLDPISPNDIGPIGSKRVHDKANSESMALWQLVVYPKQDYEQVIRRFEANYARWQKTFDPRSLALVLCAYGGSLERMGRLEEAVLAHRWASKLYPYRGFTSCDVLPKLEEKLASEHPKGQSGTGNP